MRHKKKGRKLNRTSSHRRSMFYNMSKDVLKHESIKTTLPKAKELRTYLEPIITLGKTNNLHNRRRAFDRLRNKNLVYKLFNDISKRFINRNGGYLRILKCGYRAGDCAPMAIIELVEKKTIN